MKENEGGTVYRRLKGALLILVGIFSASFGLKGFLLPNQFIDGGVTGISLLVNYTTGLPLSVLIFAINVPFIILAYTQISRIFALKTLLAIAGLSFVLALWNFRSLPTTSCSRQFLAVFSWEAGWVSLSGGAASLPRNGDTRPVGGQQSRGFNR